MNNSVIINNKIYRLKNDTTNVVEELIDKEVTYLDVLNNIFYRKKAYNICGSIFHGFNADNPEQLDNGNEALSERQLESILELNKLINTAKYLNEHWEIDWQDDSKKYFIEYRGVIEGLVVNYTIKNRSSVVYFKTKELAEKAIEILGSTSIHKSLKLNY